MASSNFSLSRKHSLRTSLGSSNDPVRSQLKRNTYPLINNKTPLQKSASIFNFKPVKNQTKIVFSDFWSEKMKAEVRNLEKKQLSPPQSSVKTPRDEHGSISEIRKHYLKSNAYYFPQRSCNFDLGVIPTIDKIIEDCNEAKLNNRKLGVKLRISNQMISKQYRSFSKVY